MISALEGGKASFRARRIADCWTASRRLLAPGALSATAPNSQTSPSAERDQEDRAARGLRHGHAATASGGSEQTPAHRERHPLHRDRDDSPDQNRAGERGGGRIRRVGPLGQQRRTQPAAEKCPDREAAEAQHPYDQSLLVAPDGHGQGEGDDHPVEAGHGFPNTSVRATTFARVNPPVTRSRQRGREDPPPRGPAREPRAQRGPLSERQRRLRQRALPLAIVALIAFILGVISAAGDPERDTANRFVQAWAHQDYKSMRDELSDSAQAQYSAAELAAAYRGAQQAATATAIDPGDADGPKSVNGTDVVDVHVGVRTRLFGKVDGVLRLPFDGGKVAWAPSSDLPRICSRASRSAAVSSWAGARRSWPSTTSPLATGPVDSRSTRWARTRSTSPARRAQPIPKQQAKLQQAGYPDEREHGHQRARAGLQPAALGNAQRASCWR